MQYQQGLYQENYSQSQEIPVSLESRKNIISQANKVLGAMRAGNTAENLRDAALKRAEAHVQQRDTYLNEAAAAATNVENSVQRLDALKAKESDLANQKTQALELFKASQDASAARQLKLAQLKALQAKKTAAQVVTC